MTQDGALSFAERVISLVDSGRKSSTYKLATLLALIDVTADHTRAAAGPPVLLSAREVGLRVLELYWPQTAIYGPDATDTPKSLRQSPQNDIPAKLAAWRTSHALPPGATLTDARLADPAGWAQLESALVAIVIGMPLAKLQRFGGDAIADEERFIYDFGWPDEVNAGAVGKDSFDDQIHLKPGVGAWLVQLEPLLRPLVQAKWAQLVARQNPDLVDAHQLDEVLFGASRISLERVRQPLFELQHGQCFYCSRPMTSAHVDHFLPWSRHPDNALDNLVAAHPACNTAKSASTAGHEHLETWTQRLRHDYVEEIVAATGWPRRRDRSLGAVNAAYRYLPERTRLWVAGHEYEPMDRARIQATLLAVA